MNTSINSDIYLSNKLFETFNRIKVTEKKIRRQVLTVFIIITIEILNAVVIIPFGIALTIYNIFRYTLTMFQSFNKDSYAKVRKRFNECSIAEKKIIIFFRQWLSWCKKSPLWAILTLPYSLIVLLSMGCTWLMLTSYSRPAKFRINRLNKGKRNGKYFTYLTEEEVWEMRNPNYDFVI